MAAPIGPAWKHPAESRMVLLSNLQRPPHGILKHVFPVLVQLALVPYDMLIVSALPYGAAWAAAQLVLALGDC